MVSVELIHMSVEHIQIECVISVNVRAGPKARRFFDFDPTDGTARCLIKDFAMRKHIMKPITAETDCHNFSQTKVDRIEKSPGTPIVLLPQ
jgi:hypothetical protein